MLNARRSSQLSTTAVTLALGLLLVAPGAATGQEPTKTDSMRARMEQASTMMGPMMGQMMEAMMDGMLKVMAKPESAERLATFSRNYYEALMKKGFTKQEALQIVIATGLPRAPSGGR